VLDALAPGAQLAACQLVVGEPGLGPGLEGEPLGLAGQGERALERPSSILELPSQKVGATDEGERERDLLTAAGTFSQLHRAPQVSERPLVSASVRGRYAEHRLDPGPLLVGVG